MTNEARRDDRILNETTMLVTNKVVVKKVGVKIRITTNFIHRLHEELVRA